MEYLLPRVFLLLLLCLSYATASKTVVSQSALNHLAEHTLVRVFEELRPLLTVPNISCPVHVPILGNFTIEAKHIKIKSLELGNLSLEIMNQGVAIRLSAGKANVTFDYSWEKPQSRYLRGNGSMETVTTVSMDTVIHIVARESKLSIKIVEFDMRVDTLTVGVQSRFSWILRALFRVLAPLIRYEIARRTKQIVPQTINSVLDRLLDQKTFQIPLGSSGLLLDMSVIEFAAKKDGWITLDQQGLIRTRSRPSPFVTNHSSIEVQQCLGKSMISLCVHKNTLVSLFQSIYEDEWMSFVFTNDNLPEGIPLLNTSWLKVHLPELYALCPNCAMRIVFSPRSSPVVANIDKSGILLDWSADLQFQVENPVKKGRFWNAFSINISLLLNFTLILKDKHLSGIVSFMDCKLNVQYTKVDDINVDAFARVVSYLVQQGVMPSINFLLQTGISISSLPIPVFFKEQEFSIHYGKDHIALGVNLKGNNYTDLVV